MNAIAHAPAVPTGPQLDNRRVLAGVVDLAIILAGGFVLSSVLALATGGEAGLSSRFVLIMVGWALYYYFAFESGDGQTLGKKLMKLRVARADGAPLELRDVTLRTLLRLVDGPFVPLVGLIVMMVTGERRQRVGDLVAGTKVVDASAEQVNVTPAALADPVAEPEAPAEPAEAAAELPVAEEPVHQGFAPPAPAPDPDFAPVAEGMSAPQEVPAAPEASDFDPYSLTQEPEPEGEVAPAAPAAEPVAEPEVEQPAYPAPIAVAPIAVEPPVEEPVIAEAPIVVEPPVEEPFASEPVAVEPVAEEPVIEEPAVEEPAVEEPVASEPVVGELVAEEPAPVEAPAADESEDAEPTPEESLAALMGHQPPAEEPAATEPPEPDSGAEPEEEVMTVRPMQTVSAIDMIMGADEDRDESPDGDDAREQPEPQ